MSEFPPLDIAALYPQPIVSYTSRRCQRCGAIIVRNKRHNDDDCLKQARQLYSHLIEIGMVRPEPRQPQTYITQQVNAIEEEFPLRSLPRRNRRTNRQIQNTNRAVEHQQSNPIARLLRSSRREQSRNRQDIRDPLLFQRNQVFNQQCPICYDKPNIQATTNCQHVYCWECLKKWLDTTKVCPVCRGDIGWVKVLGKVYEVKEYKQIGQYQHEFFDVNSAQITIRQEVCGQCYGIEGNHQIVNCQSCHGAWAHHRCTMRNGQNQYICPSCSL